MLESVVTAVAEALQAANIPAAPAYPRTEISCPAGGFVRVGVAKAVDSSPGFGRYLGLAEDPETGERELYGMRCELELSLDVYCPLSGENAAMDCAALFDRAAGVIGGIGGLGLREVHCGEPGPDRDTGLFRLRGDVKCTALLVTGCETDQGAVFTDFILRGELRRL